MKVFYKEGLDGRCAAYLVKKKYQLSEDNLQSAPIIVGQIEDNEDIFCLGVLPTELKTLFPLNNNNFIIIDNLKKEIEYKGIRSDADSVAGLTWWYLFNNGEDKIKEYRDHYDDKDIDMLLSETISSDIITKAPMFIKYINDYFRDRKFYDFPHTESFMYILRDLQTDPSNNGNIWESLFDDEYICHMVASGIMGLKNTYGIFEMSSKSFLDWYNLRYNMGTKTATN